MQVQGKTYLPISRRTAARITSHSCPIFLYHHGHGYFSENRNDFLGAEAQILAVAGGVGYWREVSPETLTDVEEMEVAQLHEYGKSIEDECIEVAKTQVNELND